MKKYILDLEVMENIALHPNYCLLKLKADTPLPEIIPGQFVEVRVDRSPQTFLRRPISINNVDREKNQLWLLIQLVGEGTKHMAAYQPGEKINLLLPLGNGFSMPEHSHERTLLIGGGVGTAPLLYLGKQLKQNGYKPQFLLGARTQADLMQIEQFQEQGTVYITTEDGSAGEKGYVTHHTLLQREAFDRIYVCGPKPMMIAVAKYADQKAITCEVSLENTMACGIGACLCCVENTKKGHVCVCTEGPVFNINQLTWLS